MPREFPEQSPAFGVTSPDLLPVWYFNFLKDVEILLMVQKSQTTTWDRQNPGNFWINYQPQRVSWSRISNEPSTVAPPRVFRYTQGYQGVENLTFFRQVKTGTEVSPKRLGAIGAPCHLWGGCFWGWEKRWTESTLRVCYSGLVNGWCLRPGRIFHPDSGTKMVQYRRYLSTWWHGEKCIYHRCGANIIGLHFSCYDASEMIEFRHGKVHGFFPAGS